MRLALLRFDDASVSPASLQNALNTSAYVIFYEMVKASRNQVPSLSFVSTTREKEEERRRKLVAKARRLRENAVMEAAFKAGEQQQVKLQEEKEMLVSRQEQAAKNQAVSLDQYDFTNSISVITETFTSLLSCSLCSSRLSSTTVFQSGQCPHLFCAECHLTISGETCPGTDRFNNTFNIY